VQTIVVLREDAGFEAESWGTGVCASIWEAGDNHNAIADIDL
jgi:hypothetical protein